MIGFIPSAALSISAFCGATVSVSHRPVPKAKWTMEKSPSVPFMDVPANLNPSLPGYAGFDPLGISDSLNIKWLQEAEIKHGRICMLAFLGALVQEVYTFPFYPDAPKLFTQGHDWGAHNGSLIQILIFTSFFEAITLPAVIQMVKGENDRQPGEFGLDLFGMMANDKAMATKEVKNGRLAILAISGILTTEVLTGQGVIAQLASGNIIPKF